MINNLIESWLIRLAMKIRAVAEPVGLLHTRPLPPDQPERSGKELTVMSANLWHDYPRYRRIAERLEAFACMAEVENADLILLQEVSRTPYLHADEWLAKRLDMACVYSRANGHETIGFEEGLAVLSRFQLSEGHQQQLKPDFTPFVHRSVLGTKVATPFGNIHAFSVHLGLLRRQNALQIQGLRNWIAHITGGGSALVGGDFNAPESTDQIIQTRKSWMDIFRHLHPHADGTTHVLRWPWGEAISQHRLDYIFLQPGNHKWVILDSRHLVSPNQPHSDHRAVLARLVLQTGLRASI
jgi:endonuclease/exonuclease/phosphatase family metal-dependent hydrolase